MASSQQRCVFVGNIPYDATEERLIQICEEVGPVVSFRLVLDRETGKPKGYGFCEYKDEETALSARRNLQGYEINGRQLRVDFAENGKGVDRNRDQGRGGPGLPPNVDSQKSTGPSILGDSSFNQPIGLQVASNAAFIISGALGQNMCNSQAGLIHDPLTNYLAAMTKKQLCDLMGELKVMAGHNKALVHQLLLESPQLSKALFQVQIMLGMVSPQVLQMPVVRQPSNSLLQTPLQENKQEQYSLYKKVPPIGTSAIPESIRVPHSSTHSVQVQHLPLHPQFHQQGQAQAQILPLQTGVSSVSGKQTHSLMEISMRTQVPVPMIGHDPKMQSHPISIPISRSDTSASVGLHNQFPLEGLIHQNMTLPHASLLTSNAQATSSSNSTFLGVTQKISEESGITTTSIHSDQTARNMNMKPTSIVAQVRPASNIADVALITTSDRASTLESTLVDVNQQSEKQVPQLPLAPEVESALLQQVMSLTPEQLSSLTPDQRQQVIQLQQMLR